MDATVSIPVFPFPPCSQDNNSDRLICRILTPVSRIDQFLNSYIPKFVIPQLADPTIKSWHAENYGF